MATRCVGTFCLTTIYVIMKKRYRYKKELKPKLLKILTISIIIAALTVVGSIVTVFANTVDCSVIDNETSYTFSLVSPLENDIIDKALEEGMPPLTDGDKIVNVDGVLIVKRAIDFSVDYYGEVMDCTAYTGDTIEESLELNQIKIAEKDIVTPIRETILREETHVDIVQHISFTLNDEGNISKHESYGGTVADFIHENGVKIDPYDRVTPDMAENLTPDVEVKIERSVAVYLKINGVTELYHTYEDTVGGLLDELEISLNDEEKMSHEKDDRIFSYMCIELDLTEYKERTETEEIDYEIIYKKDDSIDIGDSVVETPGVKGVKTFYYTQKYIGEELISEEFDREEITSNPTSEIVLQGTKVTPDLSVEAGNGSTFTDMDGNVVSYNNKMIGECTAYYMPGCITSLGWDVQEGVVAVNPDIIPYGTRMYITSGSVVYGYAVAGDTGGALLSNRVLVDLYYDSYQECIDFGRRDMTVYILD